MRSQNKNAGTVLPSQFQGFEILDPNIIYCIQLLNAAADQFYRTNRALQVIEPEKYCGYDDLFEDLGNRITSVVDALIDYAAAYTKMSL